MSFLYTNLFFPVSILLMAMKQIQAYCLLKDESKDS